MNHSLIDVGAYKRLSLQHQPLASRIAILLMVVVTISTVVLVAGIDGYVTQQFKTIHDNFLAKRTEEVKQILEREGNLLLRSIELAATDSDLVHSVHYHVNLRGEARALREDLGRIVKTFDLGMLEIRNPEGETVIAHEAGEQRLSLGKITPTEAASLRMIWHQGNLWAVVFSRLTLPPGSRVLLIAGRPLGPLITSVLASPVQAMGTDDEVNSHSVEETIRIAIEDADGKPTSILIKAPNPVGAALAKTKTLVIAVWAIASVLLLVVITVFLRIELRPIANLTAAVGEFGRGKNPEVLQTAGSLEISNLLKAFNRMVADIQRLQKLEQKIHHDRQLASIGKLAAKVAHDINNPLSVISNITRMLMRESNSNAKLNEDLSLILKNSERCANIAENLLRFSRPITLNRKPCDLGCLCQDAIEHARHRVPSLKVSLRKYPAPVTISGDEFQLGRVLDNLINNAYQACAGAEVILEYGISDNKAFVAVIDQGTGFTTEAIDHLFEPFFTTKSDGSGLGLASSLAIVRAHGGELTITAADKGLVTAWLPLP